MARHRTIAETLVDACVEVALCRDARDVARHVTALAVELLPHADGVVLHPRIGDRFLTLGVLGYPHFRSTLEISADSEVGRLLSSPSPTWARTPGEVARLRPTPADPAYERFAAIDRMVGATPHRSVLVVPCLLRERFLGALWVESWTRPRAFGPDALSTLELVAKVAAVGLAGVGHVSVFDERGRTTNLLVGEPPVPPTPTSPERPRTPSDTLVPPLTQREQEVLDRIAAGRQNQDIADELMLSINTVRTHRRSLMSKFGAHNVADLLTRAREAELV